MNLSDSFFFHRNCLSPPLNVISTKQREKYRQRLLSAFEGHYHPDYSVPRYVIWPVSAPLFI